MIKYYTYQSQIDLFKSGRERINYMQEIPEDLFILKPDPQKWSAAEISKHVARFNSLYIHQIKTAIQNNGHIKGTPQNRFYAGLPFRLAIKFLEPPYKLKISTVAPMYPRIGDMNQKTILKDLLQTQDTLISMTSDLQDKGVNLNQVKGKNPLVGWLSMSISDFLLIINAHQNRHVWQMEQTLYRLSGNSYKP